MTVLILGITVIALLSALATTGNAGNAQRNSAQSDVVMRNYAEATKAAVSTCTAGASYTVGYVAPTGFSVAVTPTTAVCPAVGSTQLLQLLVTGPQGVRSTMDIKVRTP